jgi:hypothetical protein
MDNARIQVDFNELVKEDLVLLSKTDDVTDSEGNKIMLSEGTNVSIYEFNRNLVSEKNGTIHPSKIVMNLSRVLGASLFCNKSSAKL